MNWRLILETLAAAAAAGAGDAIIQTLSSGQPIQLKQVATTALLGAIVGITNLLRKPPVAAPKPAEPPKS